MDKKKYFIKNTLVLLLGKIFTQFLSFLLLPLYTSYLTTSEYGVADLISTYVVFLAPILCLQIESAGFRFLINSRNKEEESYKIIKCILLFSFKILFYLSILMLLADYIFKIPYFIYIYLYLILYELYSLNQQFARGLGKNNEYAISSCLYGFAVIICNLLFIIKCNMGIVGLLLSYIIACLVSLLFLVYKNRIIHIIFSTKIKNEKNIIIKNGLNYSIPLIPSSISWWVLNLSDRTIISYFISAAANGIYSISNKFSSIYIGIFNIVNLSWTESVSLHIDSKDGFLEKLYNILIKFFFTILIVIIGIIPIIYPYFIGKNFYSSYYYIPILLFGSLFNVCFGLTQAIYVGLKKTKALAKTNIICALINIIINLCLIGFIGIYAAAISTFLAYFMLFIFQYYDINKYFKIKLELHSNIPFLIIFVIGIFIYYFNNIYISIIYICFSLFLLLILNIDFVKKLNSIFLKKSSNLIKKL